MTVVSSPKALQICKKFLCRKLDIYYRVYIGMFIQNRKIRRDRRSVL